MEKLLTINQICESLQVSRSLVYKWVHYDFVPHVKIGTMLRFRESELEKWLKRLEKRGRSIIRIDVGKILIEKNPSKIT